MDKLPDGEGVEENSEEEVQYTEQVHIHLEQGMVALTQREPHATVVHEGGRDLSNVGGHLLVYVI